MPPRYRTLADLRGRRVATLGATLAFDLLTAAEKDHGVVAVTYEDDVHPYSDLALGRVDAVLLDEVLAERGVRRHPGLINQPTSVGVGHYVGILAPQSIELRDPDQRHSRAGHARRPARSDLPAMEDVERRSAGICMRA